MIFLALSTVIESKYSPTRDLTSAAASLSQPDIDGGLIGGASLKPEDFFAIARIADTISK